MEGSWYYPESGQYINGQRGNESLTRYVYRENNPLNYADYSGFAPVRPTEEPEKAATNTGWRLQLGMIVENEGYTGMDNYATIILEPTVILDGYSQRIILEREIVRLNEEEEKRRKRENRQLQEERDLENFLADLDLGDIKAGNRYVPKKRPIVNIGERIENKVGGTYVNNPTDGYQIPADVILFNNNVGIPSNRESSLYLPGGRENFGMRALLMGYLQALTNDDLYLVEDKIVGKYRVEAKATSNTDLPVGTSLLRSIMYTTNYFCLVQINNGLNDIDHPYLDANTKTTSQSLNQLLRGGTSATITLATHDKIRERINKYFLQNTNGEIRKSQPQDSIGSDLIIALGHELIHALRYMRGKTKINLKGKYRSAADNGIYLADQEELDTVGINYSEVDEYGIETGRYYSAAGWWFTENNLRREQMKRNKLNIFGLRVFVS